MSGKILKISPTSRHAFSGYFCVCSYNSLMQLKDEQVVKIGITIWTIIFVGALILQLTNDKYGHWAITSVIGVALGLFGLRAIKNRK